MSFKDQVFGSSQEMAMAPLHRLPLRMVELKSAVPHIVRTSFDLQTRSVGVGRVDLASLLHSAGLSQEERETSDSPVPLTMREDVRQTTSERYRYGLQR